jgi:hypothetical protein
VLFDISVTWQQLSALTQWALRGEGAAAIELRQDDGVLVAEQGDDQMAWAPSGWPAAEPATGQQAERWGASLARLCAAFGSEVAETDDLPHRYAAVAERQDRTGAVIHTAIWCGDSEPECYSRLGESVLDGYAPDGIYDLDTDDKIEVHVATPIVRRSEDQGVTVNPLRAE